MSLTLPKISFPALLQWILVCAILTSARIADGRTITIQSNADHGPGSLRAALAIAVDGDTININAKLTILLTSGELVVSKNVMIRGPGADGPTIDGNGTSRVFHLLPGITATIDGVVITNGAASKDPNDFPANFGGGIYSDHATLTVRNCVISNNSASQGGGIYSNGEGPGSATLRVTDCTFSGNSAGLPGGAINNDGENGSAVLSITDSTLSNNIAGCDSGDFLKGGSGIFNDGSFSGSAVATVTRCMISDNGNPNCGDSTRYGGGITNIAFSGNSSLTLTETTVMRNQANYGGGLFNYADSGPSSISKRPRKKPACRFSNILYPCPAARMSDICGLPLRGSRFGTIRGFSNCSPSTSRAIDSLGQLTSVPEL